MRFLRPLFVCLAVLVLLVPRARAEGEPEVALEVRLPEGTTLEERVPTAPRTRPLTPTRGWSTRPSPVYHELCTTTCSLHLAPRAYSLVLRVGLDDRYETRRSIVLDRPGRLDLRVERFRARRWGGGFLAFFSLGGASTLWLPLVLNPSARMSTFVVSELICVAGFGAGIGLMSRRGVVRVLFVPATTP